MADSRLPALSSALTGVTVADGDLFYIVDVSDSTDDASGSSKKITAAEAAIASNLRDPGTQLYLYSICK